MCIIIAKDAGISLPTREVMENCFSNNPHGAGFAFAKDGCNFLHKGFFDFEDFYQALTDEVREEFPCIIHFRIASTGKISSENCHPFPITKDVELLKMTSYIGDEIMLAHNGIISNLSYDGLSDTQIFILEFLSDDTVYEQLSSGVDIGDLFPFDGDSNKFALLYPSGYILLVGNFIEKDQLYFSNSDYIKKEVLTWE